MKSLIDYLSYEFLVKGETTMKPPRIMAEQNDGSEELFNSHKDRWSRNAKHHIPVSEKKNLTDQWAKGDLAIFEGQEVEIVIPRGPNATIGICINGKTKMVQHSHLTKLDEAVMGGIQSVNPINRMMQLAGISNPTVMVPSEEQVQESEILNEADPTNMFNALMKANIAGEYKNNPDAARIATVGQIMVGLESIIAPLRTKMQPDMLNKLDVAVGLGAALIKTAQGMTKA